MHESRTICYQSARGKESLRRAGHRPRSWLSDRTGLPSPPAVPIMPPGHFATRTGIQCTRRDFTRLLEHEGMHIRVSSQGNVLTPARPSMAPLAIRHGRASLYPTAGGEPTTGKQAQHETVDYWDYHASIVTQLGHPLWRADHTHLSL